MIDDKCDLSSLDPTRNRARFDAMASRLAADAIAARRARASDPLGELVPWMRPALAAALLIAAASALALVRMSPADRSPAGGAASADAIGIPPRIAEWVSTNYVPSPLELVAALGSARGDRQ
jgi:hypothetical protein